MCWFPMAAMSLAVLLQGCTYHPPTGIDRDSTAPDDGPGWHAWTDAREIPDGDPRGILIGPLVASEHESDLGRIVLRLEIRHPATGDLAVRLAYDADEDGTPEVSTPIEFFRFRPDPQARELHACPQPLNGTYFFRDGADEEVEMFAPFQLLPPGHGLYLAVADTLTEDAGAVLGWAFCTEDSGLIAQH